MWGVQKKMQLIVCQKVRISLFSQLISFLMIGVWWSYCSVSQQLYIADKEKFKTGLKQRDE